MSEVKENTVVEENKEWKADRFDWIFILILMLCFGDLGTSENPRIS